MLFLGLGADGEGVEDSRGERVADGFGGFVTQISLAEDLHADDGFSLRAHLFDDGNDGVGVSVHVGADGVEADEIEFNPR